MQNSWGTEWGERGLIRLAVEDGDGVSGMNLDAEYMDVLAGYPDEEGSDEGGDDTDPQPQPQPEPEPQPDPEDSCSIDESQNRLGPEECSRDSECRGDRYCSWDGWCEGKSNCPDDDDRYPDDETHDE